MTNDEKICFLMQLDSETELIQQKLTKIIDLSYDKDEFVRSQVAVSLVYFEDELARQTLLRLACDEASIVRTEAYDSLSVYANPEVLDFLQKVIVEEKDEIACSYAIMSWTDIVLDLQERSVQNRNFITEIKKTGVISLSEQCILSCCRAQYFFGDETVLDEILSFLDSSDYHIRYSVVNVLEEILQKNNICDIQKKLQLRLISESSEAVRKKITSVLDHCLDITAER
jgi:HEAT repeat protein